ncbi:hypothetical protein EV652_101526 [Kribbella steppae]|uniref:Integral membrane protein n=1 Tax=Kribbella steppae TaxID=2512223 RepID=A0A4R2HVV2_9ACTN|nr:hypothetical protein [Kribbella steppae]TCO35641.1 hypothetical protein EV652_101526 [Kribbella steppae]
MSPVVVLLLIAGLSEAAGRVLPLVARRPGMSRPLVAGLLIAGGLIEATVIALWPLTAWTLAELVMPAAAPDTAELVWTTGLIAPLVLAAILAFPWLGPLLHLLLLIGVGAGLAGALATETGLTWVVAAGCVAVAGVGLALAVDVVRRVVSMLLGAGVREAIA